MPPKVSKRGESSDKRRRGVSPAADRLSDLHRIMSFMKTWEVVRTCELLQRWRHLWASAPCVDIRLGWHTNLSGDLAKFVYRLLLAREALAPVDTR
ncbi:hypothetical protein PR202_gb25422 [Eleusine coracana subsp. coracana]|uniref:Uncharacterized protein n=1 Tax=Eleusine coracana subsp. coracana TaxID=191504 RepID=A0AAV5FLD5_ELECO|nr:hypothetical protein PR202_gb25422 [Eleusine coracana subsp. coracana]